ncbi:MAG: hypothetical protein M1826_003099 [Phylliscum demangeonii]|nr:MAG: hypothetical protein M1826_003099 [Phylliscum demangeonii]
MLNFTPLLGAQSSSTASQSLLELDGGVKILIDVGWDESFDPDQLKELERHLSTLSIILLTHATSSHLAAYAYCCKHLPLFTRIPVYATTPVISLGRALTVDLYASTPLPSCVRPASSPSALSDLDPPAWAAGARSHLLLDALTSDEIASYFARIHPLKYSQSHQPLGSPFSPPLNGLTITAYNAGHTLGGTIWHIQHALESIVYAVDWSQGRENVISGAAWLSRAGGGEITDQLRKPTTMVCSSRGAERIAPAGGRKKRDEALMHMIRAALAKGGTVLIPTDSSARVIELAYFLEHAWRTESASDSPPSPVKNAKLYLATRSIGMTMRYAKSMLEWMEESIVREFESGPAPDSQPPTRPPAHGHRNPPASKAETAAAAQTGPFDFRYLQLLERKKDVERVLSRAADERAKGPATGMVIVASDVLLQWGFSRHILRHIAADSRNLVILTERVGAVSGDDDRRSSRPGHLLWDWWQEHMEDENRHGNDAAAEAHAHEPVPGDGREVLFVEAQRAPLEGPELLVYQQHLATQRQLSHTLLLSDGATLASAGDAADDASSADSTSSDESDSEQQGKALNVSATLANASRSKLQLTDEELGVNVLLRRPGVYDFCVHGKKGRDKMFPFQARRHRDDEFGEIIRPDEYLKAEEREEVEGQDMRLAGARRDAAKPTLGQKRRWEDVNKQVIPSNGRQPFKMVSAGPRPPNPFPTGTPLATSPPARSDGIDADMNDAGIDEANDEAAESTVTGPSKIVYRTETARLNLGIAFVDFSGLHDKRSLQMLIPMIDPRKLILIGGTKEETLSLATDCRQLLGGKSRQGHQESAVNVYTPIVGRRVDASVETNTWTVHLSQSLARRLRWQNVRGLGVVHVNGLLTTRAAALDEGEAGQGASKKQRLSGGDDLVSHHEAGAADAEPARAVIPVLESLPVTLAASTRVLAQPLHVGDLRLADLKRILQTSGRTAEYRGEGTLLVDGLVTIRKTGTGRIEVEAGSPAMAGPIPGSAGVEGSFQAVKRKIYEGLAVVAGA